MNEDMGSGSSDHATAGSHGPTATGQLQLVTFDLGGESFAVDIHAVREINRLIELTRVPNSPPEIAGVINLRGKIFPVVNLRKKFGFPEKEHDDQTRIVVLEFGGRETGFIVDRVHEVLRIDRTVVDATPEVMSTVDADFIDGIAKLDTGLLIVLNLRKLFGVLQLAEVEDLDLAA